MKGADESIPADASPLAAPERRELLRVARESLVAAAERAPAIEIRDGDFAPALRSLRASFVTLEKEAGLRGCIGNLDADRQLVVDVAHNARRAALDDPRFAPVDEFELGDIEVKVSVLSPAAAFAAGSYDELITQLRPGVDGLIVTDGVRRATFLPSVWEQVPDAPEFARALWTKARFPAGHWSSSLRLARYTTQEFSREKP